MAFFFHWRSTANSDKRYCYISARLSDSSLIQHPMSQSDESG